MKSSDMSFIGYSVMSRIGLILVFLFMATSLLAQKGKEKKPQKQEMQQRVLPPGAPMQNKKPPKQGKIRRKPASSGRKLIAQHRQKNRSHTWEVGDKLIFKLKEEGEKKQKGEINRIVPGKLLVDSVEIKLADIQMVKANLFSQMKMKSKGLGQIGLGLPIVALGTYVIIFSYESIDNESPTVVASALGMTLGAAIDLYGLSLLKKGAKTVFAGRKMDKEKGWIIKIR